MKVKDEMRISCSKKPVAIPKGGFVNLDVLKIVTIYKPIIDLFYEVFDLFNLVYVFPDTDGIKLNLMFLEFLLSKAKQDLESTQLQLQEISEKAKKKKAK